MSPPPLKNREGRPKRRPLYHASKISDARFRKVIWHFAKDDTVAKTAARTGLSGNAVNAIFVKLRRFFVEVGAFTDIYDGRDPSEGSTLATEEFEFRLIGFHIARVKTKRGTSRGPDEPDHFAESHWRFHYAVVMGDRDHEGMHRMMNRHLLELIRRCGPVGKPPVNRRAGLQLCLAQMDERIKWAERNASSFHSIRQRRQLKDILYL